MSPCLGQWAEVEAWSRLTNPARSAGLGEADARIVDETVERDTLGLESRRGRSDRRVVAHIDRHNLNLACGLRHLLQNALETLLPLGDVARAKVDVAAVIPHQQLAQSQANSAGSAGHQNVFHAAANESGLEGNVWVSKPKTRV